MDTLWTVNKRLSRHKPDRVMSGMCGTSKKDIHRVNIFRCKYTGEKSPVCPFCGVYIARTVDYKVTVPSPTMEITHQAVCGLCGTVFQYTRSSKNGDF